MQKRLRHIFIFSLFLLVYASYGKSPILTGADRIKYFTLALKDKKVGLVINHTSKVSDSLLVDYLIARGINVMKIFTPEHGLSGMADAGAHIKNSSLLSNGNEIPVISLYGKKKKPEPSDLENIDVIIFDLQDVGTRFYTYLSTLYYIMDAAADCEKQLWILDRPNPNGHYTDGPVLKDTSLYSFVGVLPIPIVHGCTFAEIAGMIVGEGWLKSKKDLNIKIIELLHYTHSSRYELPIPPSPNLKTQRAILLYPTLCLFEGTIASVGRGTDYPFECIGFPGYKGGNYSFTPMKNAVSENPLYKDVTCEGINFFEVPLDELYSMNKIKLEILIQAYQASGRNKNFFNSFFDKLSGNKLLRRQIEEGKTEIEIRETWKEDLEEYNKMRKKYMIYAN